MFFYFLPPLAYFTTTTFACPTTPQKLTQISRFADCRHASTASRTHNLININSPFTFPFFGTYYHQSEPHEAKKKKDEKESY